jgi:hypothetical protein
MKQDIDQMDTRDLDALLAEKIMGCKVDGNVITFPDGDFSYLVPDLGGHWTPSLDIRVAFEISEKIGLMIGEDDKAAIEDGVNYLTLEHLGAFGAGYVASFDCIFEDDMWFEAGHIENYPYAAKAETAALAISRAAGLFALSRKA